jgi:hypothetical protein
MTDTSRTTFEEAKLCPKCGLPGEDRLSKSAKAPGLKPGTTIHHIYCTSQTCPWYNTCWMVQVNPDGSVPPPSNHKGEKKIYAGFEGHDDLAKQIQESLMAQREREIDPDRREIRNPGSR